MTSVNLSLIFVSRICYPGLDRHSRNRVNCRFTNSTERPITGLSSRILGTESLEHYKQVKTPNTVSFHLFFIIYHNIAHDAFYRAYNIYTLLTFVGTSNT